MEAWPPYLRSYLISRIFIVSKRTRHIFLWLPDRTEDRITLKIPLLSTTDKKQLHQRIAAVIDSVEAWPPYLRSYLISRIFIVSKRTPSVLHALSQQPVTTTPTQVLTHTPSPRCPCSRWLSHPGVGNVNGHAVFRDLAILADYSDSLPRHKRCDTSIFQQNMKNAVVPSLKSLKQDLVESLCSLATSLPDHQNHIATQCIADIASSCAATYQAVAQSHPKTVYEPYIRKHGQRLPEGIFCTVLDKAPQVPIFCCANVWRHIHSATFLHSGRFKELSRFPTHRDAQCWLFWELADSISLSIRGEYCAFSVLHKLSPLPTRDLALAYQTFLSYPSSPNVKRSLLPLLDGCCAKLKSWGPSVSQLQAPGAPPTTDLLHRSQLKVLAQGTPLLPDPAQAPAPTPTPDAQRREPNARRGRAPHRPTIPPLRRVSITGAVQRRRSGRCPPILPIDEQLCTLERAILSSSSDAIHQDSPNPHPFNPVKRFLDATSSPGAMPPHIATSSGVCRRLPLKPVGENRPGPRASRRTSRFGVPDAMVMLKHKFQECTPQAKLKVREVIRHGSNPFKKVAKLMSRCLSVLWKFVTTHHSSIEIMAMHELRGFVEKLRESQSPHSDSFWGELDVEEMFPNIPKHLIPTAVQYYWSMMCRAQHRHPNDMVFHIHKSGDKSLDHAAAPSRSQSYHKVPLNDLIAFVHWDLLFNDRLVNFSSVFSQQTGCPMGGSCSAQYASIVLNYLERSVDWSLLPPIVRYRDNYLVYVSPLWSPPAPSFVRARPTIESAKQFLTQVKRTISRDSTLKLTVEGWGRSMPFLESEVLISAGLPNIEVKPPVFETTQGDSQPAAHKRLLNGHSPNTQRMLLSLVPNLVKKCAWYRFDTCSFIQNIRKVSSLLLRKGYPSNWWRPLLLAKAESIGLQQHARTGIHLAHAQLHGPGNRVKCWDGQLLSSSPSCVPGGGLQVTNRHLVCSGQAASALRLLAHSSLFAARPGLV